MKKKILFAALTIVLVFAGCSGIKIPGSGRSKLPPVPTNTPTPTPTSTCTPTPTNSPTPTYTPTPTNTPTPTFTPTPTPIPGYDYFVHSYFPILKERLQDYTSEELGDALISSAFASYDTPVDIKAFKDYEITEDKVIFKFAENSLTDSHPAFSYAVDLAEAKKFMAFDEDGNNIKESRIRKDLDPNAKMIAFTFDDGPYELVETRLMEVFDKYNARATFFVLGDRIENYASCKRSAKALYDYGCQVETHTYSHVYFRESSFKTSEFWQEINKGTLAVANATEHAPSFIRMPGGYWRDYMTNCPMPIFYWSISSGDTGNRDALPGETPNDVLVRKANESFTNVTKKAKDCGVILMHSIKKEAPDATEMIMEKLSQEGYIFVTLDELEYYKGLNFEDGVQYFR